MKRFFVRAYPFHPSSSSAVVYRRPLGHPEPPSPPDRNSTPLTPVNNTCFPRHPSTNSQLLLYHFDRPPHHHLFTTDHMPRTGFMAISHVSRTGTTPPVLIHLPLPSSERVGRRSGPPTASPGSHRLARRILKRTRQSWAAEQQTSQQSESEDRPSG
jgi:hypothetical protein